MKYRFLRLIIFFGLALTMVACQPAAVTRTEVPTATERPGVQTAIEKPTFAKPSATAERTAQIPSPVFTPLPTLIAPPKLAPASFAEAVTPFSATGLDTITPENAGQVQEVQRWGQGKINQIAFVPGRDMLAAGTTTGVYLYNAQTLEEMRLFETPRMPVYPLHAMEEARGARGFVISGDGQLVAQAYNDRVFLWQIEDGKLQRTLEIGERVEALSSSADHSRLMVATGSSIKVWNTESGQLLQSLAPKDVYPGFYSLTLSPDGQWLAAEDANGGLHLWKDAADKAVMITGGGEKGHIGEAQFSPDSSMLAGVDGDTSTLQLWRLPPSGEQKVKGVAHFAFAPDSQILVISRYIGDGKQALQLIRAEDGKVLQSLEGQFSYLNSLEFSPDGRLLAANVNDEKNENVVMVWQVVSGRLDKTLRRQNRPITGMAFSSDSRTLAIADDESLTLWQIADGWLASGFRRCCGIGAASQLLAGGKTLLTIEAPPWTEAASVPSIIRLWNIPKGKIEGTFGHTASMGVAVSTDGSMLGTVNGSCPSETEHCTIQVWRTANDSKVFEQQLDYVTGIAFSPDNRLLAVFGGEEINLLRTQDGKKLASLENSANLDHITFSKDGSQIAGFTTLGIEAFAWQAADGKLLHRLQSTANAPIFFPSAAAFSPDGSTLALGYNGMVGLWDLANGEEKAYWQAHQAEVMGLAYSPDGKLLASAAWDGTVVLSDTATRKVLITLAGHTATVYRIIFSADGKYVATIAGDGTLRFWGVP
jgi:WD40 repeat protein